MNLEYYKINNFQRALYFRLNFVNILFEFDENMYKNIWFGAKTYNGAQNTLFRDFEVRIQFEYIWKQLHGRSWGD